MLRRRLATLVSLGALSLLGACSMGADDGLEGLSGAYSAGPSNASEGGSEDGSEETDGESGPLPATTGAPPPSDDASGDAGGSPTCCESHPTAGCESPVTESCVCTSRPSCCQAVWSQECVDLASACGDPFCADETGGSTGGESTGGEDTGGESTGEPVDPPDDPPDDPPFPSCPCSDAPGWDNFCDHPPNTPGCPMTQPGGYCDPNGDGSYDPDGQWVQGWEDWQVQCE